MNLQTASVPGALRPAVTLLTLCLAGTTLLRAQTERAPDLAAPAVDRAPYVVLEIVAGSQEPIIVATRASEMATFRHHEHDLYLGLAPTVADAGAPEVEIRVIDLVEDGAGGKAMRDPAGGEERLLARPGVTSYLNRELLIDLRVLYVGPDPWPLFGRHRPDPPTSTVAPLVETGCCVSCGGSTVCGCAVGGGCGACCARCCRY